MNKVKVLTKGYAKELKDGWLASSTTTLIEANEKFIISDPGCNREKLRKALEKEKIKFEDINFVFLTHGHIDHSLLAGVFENAKFITFESLLYDKDLQLEFEEDVLGPDIKVIKTPGHTKEHISLMVTTDEGKYVIAGDVFWWVDGEKQIVDINKVDDSHPKELDMKELIKSRKTILKIADYIIPGHGKMFKFGK